MGSAVAQLSLALVESQAHARDLAAQLGAANATIATLAVAQSRELHPDPITVRQLYELFRKAFESHPSWVVMRNRLLPFVEFYGDMLCDKLKPSHWPPFRTHRLDQPIRGNTDPSKKRKMSKLTINHELGWVKRLFNWASDEEQDLVLHNPFARVKRQKCKKNRETWITEETAQHMLAAEAPRLPHARMVLRAFFLVMIDTGLRFNEARHLRRDRIRERPDGKIVVDVGRTKNGKIHYVGLTQRAFDALAEIEPVLACLHFFAHMRRKRGEMVKSAVLFSERQLRRWFRDMCTAAGVDAKVADGDVRLKPHDIRHSAATLAHRRGASLKSISRMLNHSDPSITLRYIHDEEDDAIEMAEIMEAGVRKEAKPAPGRRKGAHRSAPPHVGVARMDNSNRV